MDGRRAAVLVRHGGHDLQGRAVIRQRVVQTHAQRPPDGRGNGVIVRGELHSIERDHRDVGVAGIRRCEHVLCYRWIDVEGIALGKPALRAHEEVDLRRGVQNRQLRVVGGRSSVILNFHVDRVWRGTMLVDAEAREAAGAQCQHCAGAVVEYPVVVQVPREVGGAGGAAGGRIERQHNRKVVIGLGEGVRAARIHRDRQQPPRLERFEAAYIRRGRGQHGALMPA